MSVHRNHLGHSVSTRDTSISGDETLPRHGEGNPDLQDELLMMEVAVLRAFQAHQKMRSATKEKIVRSLRSRS